ncbi:MAG: anhydro-N-acetylmuramic acid kinase [Bacteroidota bacterium]
MTVPAPFRVLTQPTRTVAGVMSGTSLDGIDVVVARLAGSGRALTVDLLGHAHTPYPAPLRQLLLQHSVPAGSSVRALSQLNVRLAHLYAEAVLNALGAASLSPDTLDLIGCHGQTVHHVPEAADCAGSAVTSTLQLGDPSVLAAQLDVPVVAHFREADMALGGQGAPLVPYFDYIRFVHEQETRGLLNLGGIANLTVLPAGGDATTVFAFDTGPANMVIDQLAQRLLGTDSDLDGATAAQGTADVSVLATLLEAPYFQQPPPRSTGREAFGADYVDALLDLMPEDTGPADVLATATGLAALSVYQAYAQFVRDRHALDVVIASGGGVHNQALMARLRTSFAPIPVRTTADYGTDPDHKEALCFAILAHEFCNGVPTSLPGVTGARRATLLGQLTVPG